MPRSQPARTQPPAPPPLTLPHPPASPPTQPTPTTTLKNTTPRESQTLIEFGASPFADAWGNKPSALAGKTGRRNSRDLLVALEVGTVS